MIICQQNKLKTETQLRKTGEEDKATLKNALEEMKLSLSGQCKWRMFDSSGVLCHGLSDTGIYRSIVGNIDCHFYSL